MNKLVHFGAGNIGRAFIGQVFSNNNWLVVFVDINKELVQALNDEGKYNVICKEDGTKDVVIEVQPVRALNSSDIESIIEEIITCDMISTSVGANALSFIAPTIAKGILARGGKDVDIILAENIRNGSSYLIELLNVPQEYISHVGVVETSIGKMVPIMSSVTNESDRLAVISEPYNKLIVSKNDFITPIPKFEELYPVENIKAYVDRKLFVHNLGHVAVAYLGYEYDKEMKYIYESLEIPSINKAVRRCLFQSSQAVMAEYPGVFTSEDFEEYIDDILTRLRSKALKDTIFRVGRDLRRKLGHEERIVGAMLLAQKHGIEFDAIAKIYHCGCSFSALDANNIPFEKDKEVLKIYEICGIEEVLTQISQLEYDSSSDSALISFMVSFYQ